MQDISSAVRRTVRPWWVVRWFAFMLVALVAVALVLAVVVGAPPDPRYRSVTGCQSPRPRLSVLLIGNSFTDRNDLAATLGSVLCKSGMASNVRVDELAAGGASIKDWDNEGTIRHVAGHGIVVVQDQSEIPGLGATNNLYRASLDALTRLAHAATATDGRMVLFETWGFRSGDPRNPERYDSYTSMQEYVADGYAAYRDALRAGAAPDAAVAHVGDAWTWVHDRDPKEFDDLYSADGSHPSRAGTYLAALVLAEATSHEALPAHPWTMPGLGASGAAVLQRAARAAAGQD